MTPEGYDQLNRYARLIVDEALRRGIAVEIVDPRIGELVLTYGGRRMTTIESLSELTSAVAFRRCDDKLLTRRVLEKAGLHLERTFIYGGPDKTAWHVGREGVLYGINWGDYEPKGTDW